ncbi:MAG: wax ester/triacylglycerol synthase family O-acyltransferase [Rhodoferax sp.]|nr:wax ester/triacylglycerol synthase family O-acyltransferase [Rhodoferax sp.]
MTTHPMTPADAAWYHMDGPANLAVVTGLLLTRQPLDFARVRKIYLERLLDFDRFRQRVVEVGLPLPTPHWQDMPHFDIDQHVHHIALAAPHNQAALRALVSDITSTPLSRELPLWQVYVVDDVEGGSALIMRCHHCIADGTAMMTVAQRLFDAEPGAWRHAPAPVHAAPPSHGAGAGLLAAASAAIDVVTHPQHTMETAKLVLGGAGMLLAELLRADDPQSPLKGEFAPGKRVAWSKPVAIKDVKAIGAQHGAKVNDVMVAAMTGALRSYLLGRGVDVNHTTVRAMVPVDLRPPQRMGQLGNEFGLVLLDLAVTKASADQRLAKTKAGMDALKRSPEPVATRALFDLLGLVPKALEDLSNELFGRKASLVMTNVAGPREPLYLAGVAIDRILGWAPHPGRQIGMAVSIMSYQGMAALTVIGDARLVPDPEVITDHFNHEFAEMLRKVKATPAKAPARKRAAR